MRWLDMNSIIDSMDMNLSKPWETAKDRSLECCSPCGCRVGHDLGTEQQQYLRKGKRNLFLSGMFHYHCQINHYFITS